MERGDIAHYSVTERLRNGRAVTIRAVHPDDKGRMADALREVSFESLVPPNILGEEGLTTT